MMSPLGWIQVRDRLLVVGPLGGRAGGVDPRQCRVVLLVHCVLGRLFPDMPLNKLGVFLVVALLEIFGLGLAEWAPSPNRPDVFRLLTLRQGRPLRFLLASQIVELILMNLIDGVDVLALDLALMHRVLCLLRFTLGVMPFRECGQGSRIVSSHPSDLLPLPAHEFGAIAMNAA
jgi:hypothetical protein